MKNTRMMASRVLREGGQFLPLLAVGVSLSGCVFGENKQFFSESILNPNTPAAPSGTSSTVPQTPGEEEPSSSSPAGEGQGNPVPNPDVSASPAPSPMPTPVVSGSTKSDSFRVMGLVSPKIDVLFCIDNSGSMADNQRVLADSFGGFIQGFILAGLDFHIGMITTDVESTRSSVWRNRMPEYPGANRGLLLSRFQNEHFFTNQTVGLISKFQANAQVGTHGSSREQCLNSFIYTLQNASGSNSGWNAGFFRNDSLLSFVVVSDENEDIQDGESIQNRVARLRAGIASFNRGTSRGSRFDFIMNTNVAPPVVEASPGDLQYYPGRYFAASSLLSGHNYNIAQNFSRDLLTISEGMVQQASHEYTLSEKPRDPQGLEVSLNGVPVLADSSNGYVYHSDRNSIELTGSVLASAVGKILLVNYGL